MLHQFQNTILEMIARGRSIEATARQLCLEAEKLAPDAVCSILTVDAAGHMHPLGGPTLPEDYSAALDGVAIGPAVGSCGTAAYWREPVTVTDIGRDPLWAEYKGLAEPLGFKACWSSPIIGGDGQVLGTFAFYFRTNRGPIEMERSIVAACVDLCSIAIERSLVQAENRRLAYFDTLTGLPNRASFNEAMMTSSVNGPLGLLLVDIDRLKYVNDTFGHAAGDDLLRSVALRIGANASPGTAYRLGGDEFAVIVHGADSFGALGTIAARILSAMKLPAACGEHAIVPVVTIGGATSRHDDATDAEALRQHADFALYHAKEISRGEFVHYAANMDTTMTRRFRAIRDVGRALAENRIEAHYQPIVRLDTHDIVGVEALCRMRLPDNRVVSAGEFIEAVQDTSIATCVTESMLSHVAADVRSWLDRGIPFQHVGINVATVDFRRGDLQERIVAAFGRHRVPLRHVILEVTESVYMGDNDQTVARAVKALRSQGLLVALDDFGTGYASLTHLLTFPVDIIKIDRSFVHRLAPDDAGLAIVEGLIDISQKLGMRIVAEGIETLAQSAQLQEVGCMLGQGYYFARPADLCSTTERLLRLMQKRGGPAAESSVSLAA